MFRVLLSTILMQLASVDRVYIRMALMHDDELGRLGVRSLLVDVLPQAWLNNPDDILASWQAARFRYKYDRAGALFLSEFVRTEQLRSWFNGRECRLTGFDTRPGYATRVLTFDMPEMHEEGTAIRHHSYSDDGFVAMPWPHTVISFTEKGSSAHLYRRREVKPLVAPDAEYYPNFQTARAEVVHGISDPLQVSRFSDAFAIRIVHADRWLNEVRIGQNTLTAVVHGLHVAGSRVVLSGSPEVRRQQEIGGVGAVTLPIPRELPSRLTIALTRDYEELDHAVYTGKTGVYVETTPQVVVERDDPVDVVSDPTLPDDDPLAVLDDLTPEFFAQLVEPDKTVAKAEPVANDSKSDAHPKVFISYSHDTAQHARRILAFAERLRVDGIDCSIDQYDDPPPQGWPQWMKDQIEWAEYVLVVCTQTYTKRFRRKETPGKGLGATWEGAILTQQLYNQAAKNTTIVPIVFLPEDVAHIPTVLQGTTYYNVSEGPQYTKLYRRLTNQPLVVKPPLGRIKRLPPRDVETE